MICKNDLVAFIKIYFYVQYCDILNKEYNINFDPSNIREYFDYVLISEKDIFNFVCSIDNKELLVNTE